MLRRNGFVAPRAAGLTAGNVAREVCVAPCTFAEAEGELLILLTFVIFDVKILLEAVAGLTWEVLACALWSLTLVRAFPVATGLAGRRPRSASVGFVS